MHPWVVNKEKEYFPSFKRFIQNNKKCNNSIITNNISNSFKTSENDNICAKSLDFKNLQKNESKYSNELSSENKDNNNIDDNNNYKQNERQNRHLANSSKQVKNRSYCFIYTKGNKINNGVHFIQGQSGKNQNKEISNQKKDNNNFVFNKLILNKSNKDFIIKNIKNEKSPNAIKKEIETKNNFVYDTNSKRKKIKLPKVIRTEKKININKKIYEEKPQIKCINIKFKEKPKNNNINTEEKNDQGLLTKTKPVIKSLIHVQRQELDDYLKRQKKINYLNLKMQQIKEKQESVISKLRKVEDKKIREESLQKMHDSHKSSTSFDYYIKTRSLKNQYSLFRNRSKKEIGTYTIKKVKKDDESKKNKFIALREKLKEKRSYSYQHILTEKLIENKIRNLISEKWNKIKTNNVLTSNINYANKENYNYKNINNNGEDDIIIQKDNFKRFRKMVVHLKKNNNLKIQTEDNLCKRLNTCESINANIFNKISNNQHNYNYLKANKSIQNIYYNTFYNCLFNDNQKNNIINENKYYNNNIFNKKNNLKDKKELKSVSSDKNIYKFKNMFRLIKPKNNEYSNHLNKENKRINFSTERQNDHLNKSGKKKLSNTYYFKNNLLSSNLLRSLSNKKGIISLKI
jgi:hypothetical protein